MAAVVMPAHRYGGGMATLLFIFEAGPDISLVVLWPTSPWGWSRVAGGTDAYTPLPPTQAVPYGVTDRGDMEYLFFYTPVFTLGLLFPLI